VTKTTNRPTQPMRIHTRGTAGTHDLRIVDINMRWE
jgi:pantothenate kinase-related protein Tda10